MTRGLASSIRLASSRPAKPPNTTECDRRPGGRTASMAITACGTIGIDDDAVARAARRAPPGLPSPRTCVGQLGVGEGLAAPGHRVVPDQGRLVAAPFGHVPVETVVGGVELAADEPQAVRALRPGRTPARTACPRRWRRRPAPRTHRGAGRGCAGGVVPARRLQRFPACRQSNAWTPVQRQSYFRLTCPNCRHCSKRRLVRPRYGKGMKRLAEEPDLTTADRLLDLLSEAIVSGELAPGEKRSSANLAAALYDAAARPCARRSGG